MSPPYLTALFAIGILIFAFIIAGRMLMGPGTGCAPRARGGCMGNILFGTVFWGVGLAFRLYRRSFVVFGEFLSGVHDWPSYRTSSLKYVGALAAFLGFNGIFATALVFCATLAGHSDPRVESMTALLVVHLALTALLLFIGRVCFRRMP